MAIDISEAVLKHWKLEAQKDGLADEYDYHLNMIYPPLPYGQWKLKFEALNRIQAREDYKKGLDMPLGFEERAQKLCKELGY